MSKSDARGDAARLLHAAARERLSVAVTDLFLPAHLRLTEWHRTTMTALLGRLIRFVEDSLRGALVEHFSAPGQEALNAALASDHVAIAQPILENSNALRDRELVALLLRRVEEHRLHRGTHGNPTPPDGLFLELVRDPDEALAGAAMAVLVAQSRRLDRFQEPLIPSPELPAEVEHRLVWSVAAAFRAWLIERHAIAPDVADDALAAAATRHLASYDEGEGLEARCMLLVRLLDERKRLTGELIARALPEGGLSLLIAALAVRCDLAPDAVWEVVSEPTGRGLPLILRCAGVERGEAGPVLVDISGAGAPDDDARLVRQLDLFDTTTIEEARRTLRLWRVDPVYRATAREPFEP